MTINKSVDIENEVRNALISYQTVYCRPLPAEYDLPNILVTQVGGTDSQTIDTFAGRSRSGFDRLSQHSDSNFKNSGENADNSIAPRHSKYIGLMGC